MKTSDIAMYQLRVNRRTRQLAGPPVPVRKQDCPYRKLVADEVVLKCMELEHFRSLCEEQALFFSRASNFQDGLEGMPSKVGVHGTSVYEQMLRQIYPSLEHYDQLVQQQEIARSDTFVCCWRIDQFVDPQMWSEYSKSKTNEMVVVSSSVAELSRQMRDWIRISPVRYVTESKPRVQLDSLSLFYFKDKTRYGWERELRLAFSPARPENDPGVKNASHGQFVRICPNRLIHRIIPHPQMSSDGLEMLRRLARGHCSKARIA